MVWDICAVGTTEALSRYLLGRLLKGKSHGGSQGSGCRWELGEWMETFITTPAMVAMGLGNRRCSCASYSSPASLSNQTDGTGSEPAVANKAGPGAARRGR